MTTIQFACDACAHVLEVPTAFAGKRGRCTWCKRVVQVPGATRIVVAAALRAERGVAPLLSSILAGAAFGGAGLLMASRLLT